MDNFHLQHKATSSRKSSPIAIYALTTVLPDMAEHNSLLGSVVRGAYNHLYHPAGNYSRPSIARRGIKRMSSPVYTAPTAGDEQRTADLAAIAVGKLMADIPQLCASVTAIFHNQCTLDQQIVGSACLRIQGDFFDKAEQAMMIGQLGTAGIPTVFHLAELGFKQSHLTCISACDKWISPFVRRVPDLLNYGDASAACLAGTMNDDADAIAVIEQIVTSYVPPPGDIWTTSAVRQREYLLEHAHSVIANILVQHPMLECEQLVLVGDGFADNLASELGALCAIETIPNTCPDVHLSSASSLFALAKVIERAVKQQCEQNAIIWTVSQSGHAAAMLVRANSSALIKAGVWLTPCLSIFV